MTALVSRIIVPSVYRNDQRVPTANNFMIALRLLGTQTQIVDLSKSNWAPEELTYTIYILGKWSFIISKTSNICWWWARWLTGPIGQNKF